MIGTRRDTMKIAIYTNDHTMSAGCRCYDESLFDSDNVITYDLSDRETIRSYIRNCRKLAEKLSDDKSVFYSRIAETLEKAIDQQEGR